MARNYTSYCSCEAPISFEVNSMKIEFFVEISHFAKDRAYSLTTMLHPMMACD